MDDSPLQYDTWVEEALLGVVRRTLALVERQGLPDDHHFYITFRTGAEGVRMPARLRAQHPEEITIVLQNQFWDLQVGDEAFSVTLNFSRVSERLRIPFEALTSFADPAVSFQLQLATAADAAARPGDAGQGEDAEDGGEAPPADAKGAANEYEDAANARQGATKGASRNKDEDPDESAGEVIALDSFRKK